MSTAMKRYIKLVRQYPGQEQVDLADEIEVPGSWFGVGSMGSLTTTERHEKYNAQQGGVQDKGAGHPLHLPRGRSRRAEFRRLLDVEPIP